MSSEPNVLEPIKTSYKLNFLDDQQEDNLQETILRVLEAVYVLCERAKYAFKNLPHSCTLYNEGRERCHLLAGTLTCRGTLPKGVPPAIAAIWLAEDRVDSGVHTPEAALDPEPSFQKLKQREVFTKVSVSHAI